MSYPCDGCGKETPEQDLKTMCVHVHGEEYDKESFCPECYERYESRAEAIESNWQAEYERRGE